MMRKTTPLSEEAGEDPDEDEEEEAEETEEEADCSMLTGLQIMKIRKQSAAAKLKIRIQRLSFRSLFPVFSIFLFPSPDFYHYIAFPFFPEKTGKERYNHPDEKEKPEPGMAHLRSRRLLPFGLQSHRLSRAGTADL
jgi:hypothetical protein